ncbi:MAG TPA: hypothetical protein VFZ66_11765 [Herpetosiphonaceae bacterium]
MLLSVAILLGLAAALAALVSPMSAIVLLLAAAAMIALVRERVSYRQTLLALAERLDAVETLSKFEIRGANGAGAIDQALNRAIQRTREQTRPASAHPTPLRMVELSTTAESLPTVAVLSIDLRRSELELHAAASIEQLTHIAEAVSAATRQAHAMLQAQGDGTLLAIFGAHQEQAVALSIRQALDVALTLSGSHADLRFGLSCGPGRLCVLPGVGQMLVGSPLEDAVRLSRMAASWHEYSLLCTEPTALLARSFPSQRTPLQFTYAAMPTLPVYAIDLDPSAVAMSA